MQRLGEKKGKLSMNVLLYNVRGLGCSAKIGEVKSLIKNLGVNFCCLQESKIENVDEWLYRALWGEENLGWAFRASTGRSGGIIFMRNANIFAASSWWHMEGAVVVNGVWGEGRIP